MSVAERLDAVASAEELDALLRELAADPECRWRRTQILFYLPAEFHRIAGEYFDGETLAPPVRRPIHVERVDAVALDQALAALEAWAGTAAPGEAAPAREGVPRLDTVLGAAHGENDVGQMLSALAEEARTVDREAPKRYRLRGGVCTGPQNECFVYRFTCRQSPTFWCRGNFRSERVPSPRASAGRATARRSSNCWWRHSSARGFARPSSASIPPSSSAHSIISSPPVATSTSRGGAWRGD